MIVSIIFLVISPFILEVTSCPPPEPTCTCAPAPSSSSSATSTSTSIPGLPTSCPPIKTCAWGYGRMYTIYEDHPDFSKEVDYTKNIFEVSQVVDEDPPLVDGDGNQVTITNTPAKKTPHSRIYSIANLGGWGGFAERTCSLNFRIPCNSTTDFHLHGHPIIAARTLIWPKQRPTWNNVMHSFPSLVGCEVLGTFGKSWERGAWEEIAPNVCRNVTNDVWNFAVIYSIDESVKTSAGLRVELPPILEAVAAGPYMNWSCPYW